MFFEYLLSCSIVPLPLFMITRLDYVHVVCLCVGAFVCAVCVTFLFAKWLGNVALCLRRKGWYVALQWMHWISVYVGFCKTTLEIVEYT